MAINRRQEIPPAISDQKMKIKDILEESRKPFPSLEIVPPLKGITNKELIESVRPFMEFNPRYINVTCHRDEYEYREEKNGTFSRHLVRNKVSEVAVCSAVMAAYKIDVVPHMICGGNTADDIDNKLSDLKFLGIENIMALRGDCTAGEKRFTPTEGGYKYASELVAAIRDFEKGSGIFSIGVGGYPEKHFEAPNMETDIANLRKKVDAGADYIVTQMFFDNRVFYEFRDRCRKAGITVPVIPGLKPLTTARQVSLLPEAFSIDIPVELTAEIQAAGDDREAVYRTGTDWCIAQCKDLLAHGVPAVHFYTMGKAENIVRILRECF